MKQAGSMTNNVTRDAQGATKTKIATFSGQHFIAEREGEELCIYSVGDQDGLPGANVLGTVMDAGPGGLAELNRRNAARRGEKVAS
jgi:hypothetical protein